MQLVLKMKIKNVRVAKENIRLVDVHRVLPAHSNEIYRQEEAQIHPHAARHRGLGSAAS